MAAGRMYEFGEFRLDPAGHLLFRDGERLPLTPKAVDTLLVLVENTGNLVEKDDLLKKVWPDTFVEEGSLTRNISVLRDALSKGRDGRTYIETIPKRGYRFIAPVRVKLEESFSHLSTAAQAPDIGEIPRELPPEVEPIAEIARRALRRRWLIAGAMVVVLLAVTAAAILTIRAFPPAPKVVATTQVTRLGKVADYIATDGQRLYFGIRTGGKRTIAQMAIPGGEPLEIPTPFPNPVIYDISPDGSELLLANYVGMEADRPLWVMKAAGGAARRLGDVKAFDAAWSPEGQRIVYASGSDLYLVNADGSQPHKLASTRGMPFRPRWSPDGRVIRFAVEDSVLVAHSIWEVAADGTNLHPLLPGWQSPEGRRVVGPSAGIWTPDGKYFVFLVGRRWGGASFWAMREQAGVFSKLVSAPVQIYESSLSFGTPVFSRDGRKLFITARQEGDRELARYDSRLRQFVPLLPGLSLHSISYSPDGKWVCYVTWPDRTMRRARADGSEKLQLAATPGGFLPTWSPDGTRIAFFRAETPGRNQIWVIPRDGGTPVPVTSGNDLNPNWFPDGKSLLYAHHPSPESGAADPRGLYRLDIATRRVIRLPESEGKLDPSLSPDGRYVAALNEEKNRLFLFDFGTERWRELAAGAYLRSQCWSRDAQFLYYQDYYEGSEQPIYRVRLADNSIERVATSKQFYRSDVFHGYLLHGLAPDDSPVVTLLRDKPDIYALELDFR